MNQRKRKPKYIRPPVSVQTFLKRIRRDIEVITLLRMEQFAKHVVPFMRARGYTTKDIYSWKDEGKE